MIGTDHLRRTPRYPRFELQGSGNFHAIGGLYTKDLLAPMKQTISLMEMAVLYKQVYYMFYLVLCNAILRLFKARGHSENPRSITDLSLPQTPTGLKP